MCYDVAVIGGGVIGSFIARELMRWRLQVCILEKASDLAYGSSGANSGIVHGGFDPEPDTLKARFNVQGCRMMSEVAKDLDIPYKKIGSLVCAFEEKEKGTLLHLLKQGQKNGLYGLEILEGEALRFKEPGLSDKIIAALFCEESGIVSPYELTMGAAENAVQNGAELYFDSPVTAIETKNDGFSITAGGRRFEAKYIVNAAGLYADDIYKMILRNGKAGRRAAFDIEPRRGEYLLMDKAQGKAVGHVIFRVPSKAGKGILVTPTTEGNLLLGPTSVPVKSKEDNCTTHEGIEKVKRDALRMVPSVNLRDVITSFAGLRASSGAAGGDFIIEESAENFYNVAAIDSPGLTSAPAIGKYVAGEVARKLHAKENHAFEPKCAPRLKFNSLSDEQRMAVIAGDPAYANIICRCETISEGEIRDAIRRPAGARTVDGVKRRTRAGMGRCQSGFCMPKVIDILAREREIPPFAVRRAGPGSYILTDYTKAIEKG